MAGIVASTGWLTRRLRATAIERLALQPGDRVLDVGCGTGSNFPYLVEQVGLAGEVVGVEISPKMASIAQQLIAREQWPNVTVMIEAAQTAPLPGEFDVLLLFAAHEVVTSEQALENLFAHLKPGGRVLTFGAKVTSNRFGWLTNRFFRLVSKVWLPVSPAIDTEPWQLLSRRIPELQVEERVGGALYMAWGKFRSA